MTLKEPELEFLEGRTACRYSWSTGETVGSFLQALRDHGKMLGSVCAECGTVTAPAMSYCEKCGGPAADFTEVGPRGVVMSWAVVPTDFDGAPLPAPFRYVLVRLAGADTEMLHVAPDDDRVKVGAAVHPEFRPAAQRKGMITDIIRFVPDAQGEE